MKKITFLITLFLFSLFSLIFNLLSVQAAQFNQAFILTERQKANTQTTGLICAEPASAGIETSLQITFPSGFNVSPSTDDWAVATTNLPSNATTWPGINTATGVSGQTVTFPSSDLVVGTLYCFRWTSADALRTASTGGQNQATVATKTAGSIVIDSTTFQINTMTDDQLQISATVEPLARAAEMKIDGIPDTRTSLSQNQEVNVIISYKHSSNESYPFEINGEWNQGLIEGSVSNYIDIFDYVVGSASNAPDGSKPVIDIANRRITWNISSVPPTQTFQQVSFKLKTRMEIPTDSKISSVVRARVILVNSTLPEKSLTYAIKKGPLLSPTPSAVSKPQTKTPLRISSVRLDEIADTFFTVFFQTNRATTYSLAYGENPARLNQTLQSLTFSNNHSATIPDLRQNTQYYFRITARDKDGDSVTSDLFTVTTAASKSTIKLGKDDFTVFWRKYFLLSESVDSVVIPTNRPIVITARISDSAKVSRIKALFKNENVLGLSTIEPAANIEETPLVEILPGISSGEIQTPSRKGIYTIHFGFFDTTGSRYSKSAPYKFYVTDPLKVVDNKTKKPIENATVKILKYDEKQKLFIPLENSFALQSRTDTAGEVDIVLPTGTYSIEVKSPRYKTVEKRVEMGISSTNYPVFELEPDYSIIALARYYKEEFIKFTTIAAITMEEFFSSANNKDIFLIFSIIFLILLILLNWHLRKNPGMADRIMSFSFIDILEFLTILCGLLFIRFLGLSQTKELAALTLFIFALGILYIRRAFFRKKK
jgi:hypothetical protein